MMHWKRALICGANLWLVLICAAGQVPAQGGSPATNVSRIATNGIALAEVLRRVLDHNESLQIRLLGVEIGERKYRMEKGVFEPQLFGSIETLENRRENTIQQQLSTFTTLFSEHNTIYQGGLEFLVPSGAQFRLGYTLRDLSNNLQRDRIPGDEYETFAGASLVQPLLKNFGPAATLAKIRLAAVDSDMAFQDFRRQMMLVLARAESAYWDLYLTQEQVRITEESVELAKTILKDNRSRLEVGRSSDLEVLEAEAGVSLRQYRHNDALQKYFDAANRLTTLYSDSALETNLVLTALDAPELKDAVLSLFDRYRDAFELNPDYLTRRKQVIQENIKLAYARNQRFPQLDLRASYGLNGLDDNPDASWRKVESTEFPSWAIGLELRIPLTGGIRERNQVVVAKLSQQQSLISLKEVEIQIINAIDLAMRKARGFRQTVLSYGSVVDFHQQLLETQLARLNVGRTDSRTVLETEEKLSEAKVAAIDNLVQYQKALLELDLVTGSMLREHQVEVSKRELLDRTAVLLKRGNVSERNLEILLQEVRSDYERKPAPQDARDDAVRKLRQAMQEIDREKAVEPPPPAPGRDKALEILRQKLEELNRQPQEKR